MLKENKDSEVESQQTDFFVSTVERPNKYGITEDLIHKKLGNIHQNKVKRLTEEEKEILRRWKDWNLKELPEDWQSKYNNLIKASEALAEWKKYFGDKKPLEVKNEYDKPKEQHKPEQLKPTDLPDNWKTELSRIPGLEARPTQEQLNNAVQKVNEKYKDYDKIKTDLTKLQGDLNIFFNNYKVKTLVELETYIAGLKKQPELSEKDQEHKEENRKIKQVIEKYLESERVKRYTLTYNPTLTLEQTEEAIIDLLENTRQEWREYLKSGEEENILTKRLILVLSFWQDKKKHRASQILDWIREAREGEPNYLRLFINWNGGKDYSKENDFDGSLLLLGSYLKKYLEYKEIKKF